MKFIYRHVIYIESLYRYQIKKIYLKKIKKLILYLILYDINININHL